jgi:predicted HTH transcriptional regulator
MEKLQEIGILEREGSRKSGRWLVKRFDDSYSFDTQIDKVQDVNVIVPYGTINGTIYGTISEFHERLIKAISDNPAITYDNLAALLSMPRRTVSREMKKLQEIGILEREGSRKNGRWLLKR